MACRWLSCGGLVGWSFLSRASRTYVEVGGDGNDGVGNLLTEVALSNLLHLAENHSRNLLRSELLLGTIDLDLNNGAVITVDNLEGEVLDIALEGLLGVLAANETPR